MSQFRLFGSNVLLIPPHIAIELNVSSMTLEEDFMGHNSINIEENEVHISGCTGTFSLKSAASTLD